jgi:hypothetical protein
MCLNHQGSGMPFEPLSIARILERIERHPRLQVLCNEFDNAVAKAFRGDVHSLRWLVRSCPDLLTAKEVAQALTNLRNRYLVVPSEFRDLIDDAVAETDPILLELSSWRSSVEVDVTDEDLLETG